MGIISGSGSFRGRFGDHFRVGDHFGGCTVLFYKIKSLLLSFQWWIYVFQISKIMLNGDSVPAIVTVLKSGSNAGLRQIPMFSLSSFFRSWTRQVTLVCSSSAQTGFRHTAETEKSLAWGRNQDTWKSFQKIFTDSHSWKFALRQMLSMNFMILKPYTRFQCYVHRRHLRLSFDMLCNLAHFKMLTQRTLSRSNSTFSHKRWIYFTSN